MPYTSLFFIPYRLLKLVCDNVTSTRLILTNRYYNRTHDNQKRFTQFIIGYSDEGGLPFIREFDPTSLL